MTIKQTNEGIFLSQETYIGSMIRRFKMEKATPIYSPMDLHVMLDNEVCEDNPADRMLYLSIVGSLMFAAFGTRPDIAFSVTALSRYNVQPLQMHLSAAKRALRYLAATKSKGLFYPVTSSGRHLHGYRFRLGRTNLN